METDLVVGIIAAMTAIFGTVVALVQSHRITVLTDDLARRRWEDEKRHERQEVVGRFREPLARAAYDLQSRLYNVLQKQFLGYLSGKPQERAYVVENTAFLVAQYFAWTEIVRREIQYIDLETEAGTAELAHRQDELSRLWGDDSREYGNALRIWAGEQRAIGELLIEETDRGPRCMGYARFVETLRGPHDPFLDTLVDAVRALPQQLSSPRLVKLQNALIDQLEDLDPGFVRFPKESRAKVGSRPAGIGTAVPAPPLYGVPAEG